VQEKAEDAKEQAEDAPEQVSKVGKDTSETATSEGGDVEDPAGKSPRLVRT